MLAVKMLIFWCAASLVLHAQQDDFEDGNDDGWTRFDPLGGLGAGAIASFEVEDGAYRIKTLESPSPTAVGPSRAASFRQDQRYHGSVFVSVDLVIPDLNLQQSVGVLAFMQPDPALGAASGYSLSYQPVTHDLVLNRLTNESATRLAAADLTDSPEAVLRLTLACENGHFVGRVFNLSDLRHPIATVTAHDVTYTSGTSGVFIYADTVDSTGTTDALFDHYRAHAFVEPPLEFSVTSGGGYALRWPTWAIDYVIEWSPDLSEGSWEILSQEGIEHEGDSFVMTGDLASAPRAFYRLVRLEKLPE